MDWILQNNTFYLKDVFTYEEKIEIQIILEQRKD